MIECYFRLRTYLGDYKFIPEKFALDVLVSGTKPCLPMCMMEIKSSGVFHMANEKRLNEKLVCVSVSDPFGINTKTLQT